MAKGYFGYKGNSVLIVVLFDIRPQSHNVKSDFDNSFFSVSLGSNPDIVRTCMCMSNRLISNIFRTCLLFVTVQQIQQ